MISERIDAATAHDGAGSAGFARSSAVIFAVTETISALGLIHMCDTGDGGGVVSCATAMLLICAPRIVRHVCRVEMSAMLENTVMCFAFCAQILGEACSFYERFPLWDTGLHLCSGFLAAAVGCSLIALVNGWKSDSLELPGNIRAGYVSLASYCFGVVVGTMWEFYEFTIDALFGCDMQKDTVVHGIHSIALDPDGLNKVVTIKNITKVSVNGHDLGVGGYLDIGLYDTMKDLLVGASGALLFAIVVYVALKTGRGRSFVGKLMLRRRGVRHG